MNGEFEVRLQRIKELQLEKHGEAAVINAAILPLLGLLGWDSADVTEVVPQYHVGTDKVDFSLRVNDVNRVFVEAKAGREDLRNHVKQLRDYCEVSTPNLAVLTNGNHWWLYHRLNVKSTKIEEFLAVDITVDHGRAEEYFRQFLARDRFLNNDAARDTVSAARAISSEKKRHSRVMDGLAEAWNALGKLEDKLTEVIITIVDWEEIIPSEAQVREFIKTRGPLVNTVAERHETKRQRQRSIRPTSFTFNANGESQSVRQKPVTFWTEVLVGVCELMLELHRDTFSEKVLEMSKRFSRSKEGLNSALRDPIGDTGIFVAGGSSDRIKDTCYQTLAKFGYSPDSLTISVSE